MADVLFISLIQLIQNPEQYATKRVRVMGFASIQFEGRALFVREEDYRNAITKNGVWLSVEINDTNKLFHERYVLVEGVFSAQEKGHLKMYSGSINEVNRLELWSDPKATSPNSAIKK